MADYGNDAGGADRGPASCRFTEVVEGRLLGPSRPLEPLGGLAAPAAGHRPGLTALTVFDAVIAWLTPRESRKQLVVTRR